MTNGTMDVQALLGRARMIAKCRWRMFTQQQVAHYATAGRTDECEDENAEQVEIRAHRRERALNRKDEGCR